MALGQAVMAAVFGAIQGGIYGAIVGLAVSLISSAVEGDFSSQTSTIKSAPSATANSGVTAQFQQSSLMLQQFGSEYPLTSSMNQGANTFQGSTNINATELKAPSGASGIELQTGKGSAAGGVLVGAQTIQ
jgi:hypothetical protein